MSNEKDNYNKKLREEQNAPIFSKSNLTDDDSDTSSIDDEYWQQRIYQQSEDSRQKNINAKKDFNNHLSSVMNSTFSGKKIEWNDFMNLIIKIFSSLGQETLSEKDLKKRLDNLIEDLQRTYGENNENDNHVEEITEQHHTLLDENSNSPKKSLKLEQNLKQATERKMMPVAKDGNCLINSLILSYLGKEKNNKDNFILKAKKIFPILPSDIQNYDELFHNFKTFQENNSKLNNLGQILRKQLADHINKTLDPSYFPKDNESDNRSPELIKQQYLEKLKQNGTWCDEREIKAFSELFDSTINVEREGDDKQYTFYFGEKKESPNDSLLELHFINNHYSYYERNLNDFNNSNYKQDQGNIINSRHDPLSLFSSDEEKKSTGRDNALGAPRTRRGINQPAWNNYLEGANSSQHYLLNDESNAIQDDQQQREIGKKFFDSDNQILS